MAINKSEKKAGVKALCKPQHSSAVACSTLAGIGDDVIPAPTETCPRTPP